ncbi:hypothetical protein GUJ93_ZPchr0013g35552 [Zizania palustris]|uniref:Uncharacterized protein n=1 Tax=Zizania palustris TaxID=103762 RepID=A0A8J5WS61_ZIZPA|nr:hypothetical protein GUJ93_ZPchr0013g35552 [Zizania palustris]
MEDVCATVPHSLGLEANALRLSAHIFDFFDGHDGAEVPDAQLLLPLKLHSYAQAGVERSAMLFTMTMGRALVKPADLRSFGDGSTSLFFKLF